jgi:uncharacterized Zn finger protein (UPF0148 family)
MANVCITCPACGTPIETQVRGKGHLFLLFCCPMCSRNVVQYEGKVTCLSDAFVKSLREKYKLKSFGSVLTRPVKSHKSITEDDINDLRILLNTEPDFNKLLQKL